MSISKTEHTKTNIINTFFQLIPSKPWDKISVMEICETMNISRGTFYRYFSDIYELMEEIQTSLLEDLEKRYQSVPLESTQIPGIADLRKDAFNQKDININCVPPKMLTEWFAFCNDHKQQISILLHPTNGDPYFKQKLKKILKNHINLMMDADHCPKDKFRTHFVKLFVELHFLSTQTWLDGEESDFLSISEIVDVLNTMRIGANYLAKTQYTSAKNH